MSCRLVLDSRPLAGSTGGPGRVRPARTRRSSERCSRDDAAFFTRRATPAHGSNGASAPSSRSPAGAKPMPRGREITEALPRVNVPEPRAHPATPPERGPRRSAHRSRGGGPRGPCRVAAVASGLAPMRRPTRVGDGATWPRGPAHRPRTARVPSTAAFTGSSPFRPMSRADPGVIASGDFAPTPIGDGPCHGTAAGRAAPTHAVRPPSTAACRAAFRRRVGRGRVAFGDPTAWCRRRPTG